MCEMLDDETVASALRACPVRHAEGMLPGWFELQCVLTQLDPRGEKDAPVLLHDLHEWLIAKGGDLRARPPDPETGVVEEPGDISNAWLPPAVWQALERRSKP